MFKKLAKLLIVTLIFNLKIFAQPIEIHYLDEIKKNYKYSSGNQIKFLPDGAEDYQIRTKMIDEAKKYVHLYTLLFEDNETGRETAIQLSTKAFLEEVEVNVIHHALSQFFSSTPAITTAMRNMNVNVRGYWAKNTGINLIKRFLLGSHKKLLIVDSEKFGQEAIVGGRNIGDNYFKNVENPVEGEFNNLWKDNDYLLRGPVVADLMKKYMVSFNEQTKEDQYKLECLETTCNYFPKLIIDENENGFYSNIDISVLENEPTWKVFEINEVYGKLIDNAKVRIDIQTPYFIPSKKIFKKLVKALERGVEVRIITNSRDSNDLNKVVFYVSSYFWKKLIKKGAKVYIWYPPRGPNDKPKGYAGRCYHSKVMIVDSYVFVPGSWNFDNRSMKHDNEYAFPIYDKNVAKAGLAIFEGDLKLPGMTQIDLKWYKDNFSFWNKVFRRISLLIKGIL
ncbi:MAG: phosphatidylserine/phosphatidylglycerophosphate/cardiolipin synthase family protein [Bacteriovoracaceae bacterium]